MAQIQQSHVNKELWSMSHLSSYSRFWHYSFTRHSLQIYNLAYERVFPRQSREMLFRETDLTPDGTYG